MEDEIFKKLDNLNIIDTNLLLDKDISLSIDYATRKRIEKSVKQKTGYYNENNKIIDKINNILGGIFMKRKIALALSACTILGLGGGTYTYAATTPVAYVSMDINPSVELGVNAFDKVISVEAYNEDGENVLENTNLVNYDVDNAVSTVISNAISEGYINEDGSSAIEITTATDKEKVATKLEESLNEIVDKTLDNNDVEAEIGTENVALARRDEARKLGITPGKLNLIQKLQELDPTIQVEDYKSSSVKDIQKKTKELRKNNNSDETTTDSSTSTYINTDTNAEVVTEGTAQEGTVSETSVEPEEATTVETEKNKNSFNNSNIKKEENSNHSIKKEENSNVNKEKSAVEPSEKQSNNVKSQSNNNSSNSENSKKNSNVQDNNSNNNNGKNK